MARTAAPAPAATFVQPAAPAPAAPVEPVPEAPQPADPFANLAVYSVDDWAPPAPEVSPMVEALLKHLNTAGGVTVSTDGWDTKTARLFLRQVASRTDLTGGRKVASRVGRADGKPALRLTVQPVAAPAVAPTA